MRFSICFAAGLVVAGCFAGCSSSQRTRDGHVVDVAGSIGNLTELKVSQLGSKITYIPLETNDSSLLDENIGLRADGNTVVFYPLDGYKHGVLSFDITSGRFLGAVGHPGQDPEAYARAIPTLSADGSSVYFDSYLGRILKYSPDGRFESEIMPAVPILVPFSVVSDSTITGRAKIDDIGQYAMTFCSFTLGDTVVTDTCRVLDWSTRINVPNPTSINSITVIEFKSKYRNTPSVSSILAIESNEGDCKLISPVTQLARVGEELHFSQQFVDTIYKLERNAPARPAYVFDMGEHHAEYADLIAKPWQNSSIMLMDVIENTNMIVFSVVTEAAEHESKTYIGYFDKQNGTTAMSADGFVDDLTGFGISFMPLCAMADGRLVSFITIDQLYEYFDANPDAEVPSWAEGVAEDANPILVVVDP